MADPQITSDLTFLLAREGNQMIWQQAAHLQRLLALVLPAEDEYEEPPVRSRYQYPVSIERDVPSIDVINVEVGTTSGIGIYTDGGPRPQGAGRPATQGRKTPVLIGATVKLSLSEVDLARGDGDAINKFLSTVKAHGSGWGATVARFVHDPALAPPTGVVALNATSMTTTDPSGYLEGGTCEVRVTATGALVGTFDVKINSSFSFSGNATISFTAPLTFSIDPAVHTVYLLGGGGSDTIGSLADATDSSLDMYGLDRNTDFPAGQEENVSGAWSNHEGKDAISLLEVAGSYPTCIVAHPRGRDHIMNAQGDQVRYMPGVSEPSRDPYWDTQALEFAGMPVVACPQCPMTTIVVGDFERIRLREKSPYRPRLPQGGEKGDMSRSSLFTSENFFAQKLLMEGFYSTVITKRRAFFRFLNVTS